MRTSLMGVNTLRGPFGFGVFYFKAAFDGFSCFLPGGFGAGEA